MLNHAIAGLLLAFTGIAQPRQTSVANELQTVHRIEARCLELFSTHERAMCLWREAAAAKVTMDASLKALEAADEKEYGADYEPSRNCGASPCAGYDPRPEMHAAQAAWQKWMRTECEMEADLARGSAGAIIEPLCQLRLTRARQAELEEIARFPGGY